MAIGKTSVASILMVDGFMKMKVPIEPVKPATVRFKDALKVHLAGLSRPCHMTAYSANLARYSGRLGQATEQSCNSLVIV